jgi:hypothetical protein
VACGHVTYLLSAWQQAAVFVACRRCSRVNFVQFAHCVSVILTHVCDMRHTRTDNETCLYGLSARSHNIRNVYARQSSGVGERHAADGTADKTAGWTIRGSIPGKDRFFLFCKTFRSAVAPTQPPIQWDQGVKAKGKVDPSHLCHTEVKNGWSYATAPSIHLHGVYRKTGAQPEF